MLQGCRILERNVYSRFGEIDIVAEKGGVLHFVEVKSGTTFEPIYNITPSKLAKLLRSIDAYLKKHRLESPYQLDALIVKGERCEWIENITV
ncbi:YraN family protein [Hydrogenimonas cancrithermarum]|nr:YraN family protein [Hydrogenimonas cancrithermarum]